MEVIGSVLCGKDEMDTEQSVFKIQIVKGGNNLPY